MKYKKSDVLKVLVDGCMMTSERTDDVWIIQIWEDNGEKYLDAWYKCDIQPRCNVKYDFLIEIKGEGEKCTKRDCTCYAKDPLYFDVIERIKDLEGEEYPTSEKGPWTDEELKSMDELDDGDDDFNLTEIASGEHEGERYVVFLCADKKAKLLVQGKNTAGEEDWFPPQWDDEKWIGLVTLPEGIEWA